MKEVYRYKCLNCEFEFTNPFITNIWGRLMFYCPKCGSDNIKIIEDGEDESL